jgi:hypothetical protein
MLILTHTAPKARLARPKPLPVSNETVLPQGDSVTFGSTALKPASPAGRHGSQWKAALIGGAAGAVLGGLGGALGGSVGSIAVAPVVALMGGAAAASAFKFHGDSKGRVTSSAETRSLLLRVAGAGLAGAAVVGLGLHGGVIGAVAAGVGGLATGAALGYGFQG